MGHTILVIDDEQSLREEILDILTFEGFSVTEAGNGHDGVRMAQKYLPDLIICDVMMPEMDGYSTLSALRTHPETAMIPFIFLTAKSQRSNIRQGMESGANDYLTKPFTTAELLGAVRTRLAEQTTIAEHYEQKLNHLRSTIIHVLPHELRTPLVAILGFAELLVWDADHLATDQIREMAEAILQGGKRLHKLIENYLLYAQIEIITQDAKKLDSFRRSQTTDTNRIISEIAIDQARLVEREPDLALQISADTIPVKVSQDDLKRIVEELVNNAFKFSNGGTEVCVFSAYRGKWYELIVEDNGRGMTPHQIRECGAYMQFDRAFFEQQGSGLGLVIAKRLVEMYGGVLLVESVPTAGTRIVVNLPLVE